MSSPESQCPNSRCPNSQCSAGRSQCPPAVKCPEVVEVPCLTLGIMSQQSTVNVRGSMSQQSMSHARSGKCGEHITPTEGGSVEHSEGCSISWLSSTPGCAGCRRPSLLDYRLPAARAAGPVGCARWITVTGLLVAVLARGVTASHPLVDGCSWLRHRPAPTPRRPATHRRR